VDKFVDEAGEINGLVQAHGNISRSCSWEESNNNDWLTDLNVNLISSFFLAQRAIYHMREKGGAIILMSTASATRGGGSNSLPYGVSKYGVQCIVKRLARDSGKYGIRINAVAPGYIQTKLHKEFHNKQKQNNDDRIKLRIKNIPLNQVGTTQNVADVISNLLLDEKSFITGQIITIDGGDFI
jgi:3-oxoacyl-[acyl-carrier protein] reductase